MNFRIFNTILICSLFTTGNLLVASNHNSYPPNKKKSRKISAVELERFVHHFYDNLFNILSIKGDDGKTILARMVEEKKAHNISRYFEYLPIHQIYNLLLIPDNNGDLPLTTAIINNDIDTTKLLLEKIKNKKNLLFLIRNIYTKGEEAINRISPEMKALLESFQEGLFSKENTSTETQKRKADSMMYNSPPPEAPKKLFRKDEDSNKIPSPPRKADSMKDNAPPPEVPENSLQKDENSNKMPLIRMVKMGLYRKINEYVKDLSPQQFYNRLSSSDDQGEYAAILAVQNNYVDTVRSLLDKIKENKEWCQIVITQIRDKKGKSALDYASPEMRKELANYLF